MIRARWIAGAIVAVGVCAACSTTTPHLAVTPLSPVTTVGLDWTLVSVQRANVIVQAVDGSCDDGPHAAVVESSTFVAISITTHPNSAASCDAAAHPKRVTVVLAAPLNRRGLTGCAPQAEASRDCNQIG